jgi:ribosomal protein S27AE
MTMMMTPRKVDNETRMGALCYARVGVDGVDESSGRCARCGRDEVAMCASHRATHRTAHGACGGEIINLSRRGDIWSRRRATD